VARTKKSRGPWDNLTITAARKKEGFTSIGTATILKNPKPRLEILSGAFRILRGNQQSERKRRPWLGSGNPSSEKSPLSAASSYR
jgi:hypothetical protein